MVRHVTVSSERDTPLDVLALLRQIDPTLELIYIGNGQWWVGAVTAPNKHRYRSGFRIMQRVLKALDPDPCLAMHAELECQGFALIAAWRGEPGGHLVDDVRRRDWEWRYDPDRSAYHEEERQHESRLARLGNKVREYLKLEKKTLVRAMQGNPFIGWRKQPNG